LLVRDSCEMVTEAQQKREEEWAATIVIPASDGSTWSESSRANMLLEQMMEEDIMECLQMSGKYQGLRTLLRLLGRRRQHFYAKWAMVQCAERGHLVAMMALWHEHRLVADSVLDWALRAAAGADQVHIFQWLSSMGACDLSGALYSAAREGAHAVCHLLLWPVAGTGGVIDAVGGAIKGGHFEIFKTLLDRCSPHNSTLYSWFLLACQYGRHDIALHLDSGIVLSEVSVRELSSAVGWACHGGDARLITLCLSRLPEYRPMDQQDTLEWWLQQTSEGSKRETARWLLGCWTQFGAAHFLPSRSLGRAAIIYALVVYLCDGSLAPLSSIATGVIDGMSDTDASALRFLSLVARLPMELMMMTCNYTEGISRAVILLKHSEAALRLLGSLYPT